MSIIYIIIEQLGEYSDSDWHIVDVLTGKEVDALRAAWKLAMNAWQNDYAIQMWNMETSF